MRVKQVNNLTIRASGNGQYSVWTPDGRCWEDRLTLAQAEDFCRKTTDFVAFPVAAEDIAYVEGNRKKQLSDKEKLKIGTHMKRYGLKSVGICAWYEDLADFFSDWCGIGYTRKQARKLLHGGKGEFMVLPGAVCLYQGKYFIMGGQQNEGDYYYPLGEKKNLVPSKDITVACQKGLVFI